MGGAVLRQDMDGGREMKLETCDNCGACCMHMGSPPFVLGEAEVLPDGLQEELDQYLDSPRCDDRDAHLLQFGECKTESFRHNG